MEDIVKSQRSLIQQTRSSKQAHLTLFKELCDTLEAITDKPNEYVITVDHSQGCLILRQALEGLVAEANPTKAGTTEAEDADLSKLRGKMSKRLCVFTFGNPSLH
jgi:hypothetical protein